MFNLVLGGIIMAKKIISVGLSILYIVIFSLLAYLLSNLFNVNFDKVFTSVLGGGFLRMSYDYYMISL